MGSLSIPVEYLGDVVLSRERTQSIVKRLAKEIFYSVNYVNERPLFLCLREGAVPFHKNLTEELEKLDFKFDRAWLDTHHRYNGTESSGTVEIFPYTGPSLEGRVIVIVEDIIDSSDTITKVCEFLDKKRVKQRTICTFLFKERPENIGWRNSGLNGYEYLPEVRHVGSFIVPLFVVGYGLDYNQYGRDGDEVRVLTPEGQTWIDKQIEK